MSSDDNELTSLAWLHTLNILPQHTNTTSKTNKANEEVTFCLRSPKTSSQKKNTNQPGSSCKVKNESNSSNYTSTNSSSIPLGQQLEKHCESQPFTIPVNNTLSEICPNVKIHTFTRNQSEKVCISVEETATSNTTLKNTTGLPKVSVGLIDILNALNKAY